MSDSSPHPQSDDHARLLSYSNPTESATHSFASLKERILAVIARNGPIPFPRFMEIALYDPQDGYYAREPSQVGKSGDFYTSVSVGPLFGRLLARRFLKWWHDSNCPAEWRILEIGAHDGKLAADILAEIATLEPHAWDCLEYATIEPLPALRIAQSKRLGSLASKLSVAEMSEDLSQVSKPTIAFGNEVLDALPFHLVRISNGEWRELFVSEELEFIEEIPEAALSSKLCEIGFGFPDTYQTEVRTVFGDFIGDITRIRDIQLFLFFDYGYAAPEYYDPQRTTGTLRTFSKHQAAEDPLQDIGEIDITAHVDFTDLADAMSRKGFHPTHFSTQSSYLTHLATEMIKSGKLDDRHTISQFQSLTHPAHLGNRFRAIEFSRQADIPSEVKHRLALR